MVGKQYTLREERELNIIEKGLKHVEDHWEAKYPWIKDPYDVPDNKVVAISNVKIVRKTSASKRRSCRDVQEANRR